MTTGGHFEWTSTEQRVIPTDLAINNLTLRDYFAAAIINGMMAGDDNRDMEKTSIRCYAYADAMLAERAKEKP